MKILITSVGSLVGQNILDVLESKNFYRRDKVKIIGTNSIAGSPNNFRCDSCYLVSNTSNKEFKFEILEIINKEQPDLILSGRDEDTEAIVRLKMENPKIEAKHPYGKVETLFAALNKLETWNFSVRNNLAFADTYVVGKNGDLEGLKNFIEKYGYPLIAKPIQGFASKGVFYVRSWQDAEDISKLDDYMFQEYLGDAKFLETYFTKFQGPTPLFAHAPNIYHFSCHTVINPDGTYDPIFISRNEHDSGVTIGFRRVFDEVLENLTVEYLNAIHQEGGFGPVTVQFREDQKGNFKAQEMNMRTNGNTYPRFLMGQDDLGLIVNYLFPDNDFPIYRPMGDVSKYIIGKSLRSDVIFPNQIQILKRDKHWNS